MAYIDFTRALDSISYPKLFRKLKGYGIGGNLLFWIKAFLTHRTQCVCVGTSISSVCVVSSGVPQGSCLGPLLFNRYINDVTDSLHDVSAKLFVDDLKLYTEINASSFESNFQANLNHIFTWASSWQLQISHSKCNIMKIGRTSSQSSFFIDNKPIVNSNLVKDLGVFVNSDLNFSHHIHDFVTHAKQ